MDKIGQLIEANLLVIVLRCAGRRSLPARGICTEGLLEDARKERQRAEGVAEDVAEDAGTVGDTAPSASMS